MNDGMSLAEREQQVYVNMSRKLVDTGEKERIKEWFNAQLEECGWKDQLRKDCVQYAKTRAEKATKSSSSSSNTDVQSSSDDVSLDDLLKHFLSKSKDTVPASIKMELLQKLRTFMSSKETPQTI